MTVKEVSSEIFHWAIFAFVGPIEREKYLVYSRYVI